MSEGQVIARSGGHVRRSRDVGCFVQVTNGDYRLILYIDHVMLTYDYPTTDRALYAFAEACDAFELWPSDPGELKALDDQLKAATEAAKARQS